MVCLNLDDYDANLIEYAGILSKMARSDEVHFVYVLDTFDVPKEIKKIYPELASPLEIAAEERMRLVAGEHFRGVGTAKLIFSPLEGSRLGLLISYTKKNDIDLLIVGHHTSDRTTSNSLAEKLARKAFCSVMVVPRQINPLFEKILVAVDFSDHSLNALDVATAFAKAADIDHIYILNTYQVPPGHHKTGKTYDEFGDIMLENAKSKLQDILSKVDLKSIVPRAYFKKNNNIIESINCFSENMGADIVVVGARGRSSDIAAILLGSITEGLIRKTQRTLLAVKEKGEGLNILEALASE